MRDRGVRQAATVSSRAAEARVRTGHGRLISQIAAGLVTLLTLVASPAVASASPVISTPKLVVSKTTGLNPAGTTVTVTGSGYDDFKGVYVALCVIPPSPTLPPSPCGGGIAMEGSTGSSQWISSNPPSYGVGLAIPYGPGGTFSVTLTVSSAMPNGVDCRTTRCAIYTRNDHTRSGDRSQDVAVPVSFIGGAPATTAPPTTRPQTTSPPTTPRPVVTNPPASGNSQGRPGGSLAVPAEGTSSSSGLSGVADSPAGQGGVTPGVDPATTTTSTTVAAEVEAKSTRKGGSTKAEPKKASTDGSAAEGSSRQGSDRELAAKGISAADDGTGGIFAVVAILALVIIAGSGVFVFSRRRNAMTAASADAGGPTDGPVD